MKNVFKACVAATVVILGFAHSAEATPFLFDAVLSGANESPPNASLGTGLAVVIYDDAAHTLRVEVTFSGLLGTTTAAHIHCCTTVPFTGTAGVATTPPAFVGFPLGVTSGSLDATYDLTQTAFWNPPFLAAHGGTAAGAEAFFAAGLGNGTEYFNIHTSVVGGGEIRGFLVVPEPTTLALFGAGLAGLAVLRRRRKAKA